MQDTADYPHIVLAYGHISAALVVREHAREQRVLVLLFVAAAFGFWPQIETITR